MGGSLTPLQRCSLCILQPQPTVNAKYLAIEIVYKNIFSDFVLSVFGCCIISTQCSIFWPLNTRNFPTLSEVIHFSAGLRTYQCHLIVYFTYHERNLSMSVRACSQQALASRLETPLLQWNHRGQCIILLLDC